MVDLTEAQDTPGEDDAQLAASMQQRSKPEPLNAEFGMGLLGRNYTYNQPVGDVFDHRLQRHARSLMVMELSAGWYPAAHAALDKDLAFLAYGGIVGYFSHSLAGTTQISTASFNTSFSDFHIGVRGRIPFGMSEAGLMLGWGQQELNVSGDNSSAIIDGEQQQDPGIVPDASYGYFRLGPDVRWVVWRLIIRGGGYLNIPSIGEGPGEIKNDLWFPNATGFGWELDAGVEFPFHPMFSAFFDGGVRYYALSMNSDASSAIEDGELNQAVAGGASDLYVSLLGGVRFTLPNAH